MNAPDVNDLIGKPYRLGARGPDAFDCWGLVLEVLRRLQPGQPLPDWASEGMSRTRQRELMHDQAAAALLLPAPVDGCLLLSERRGHIGILLRGRVIHAARLSGVIATRLGDFVALMPDARAYAWRM